MGVTADGLNYHCSKSGYLIAHSYQNGEAGKSESWNRDQLKGKH